MHLHHRICHYLKLVSVVGLMLALLAGSLGPFTPTLHSVATAQEPVPATDVPASFVTTSGSQLVLNGAPVQLNGVLYNIPYYSSRDIWIYWDATRIAHDLRLLREQTGANVVFFRLPYDLGGVSPAGKVSDELGLRLRELLQIAGNFDMRVVFTLFEGYTAFPIPGRNSEALNLAYLDTLLSAFAEDPRVLGWDIYFKPDGNSLWSSDPERVVSWLVRMANQAQKQAPNQLIMVSMKSFANTWRRDFDGHRALDHVDLVLVRSDDPEEAVEEVARIREETDKPVLIYDYQWSSGPLCRSIDHTEERQKLVYQSMLGPLAEGYVVGLISRQLRDVDSGPLHTWDSRSFYEGLYRPDGSPKPVTAPLRDFGFVALPSFQSDALPLRTVAYKNIEFADPEVDPNAPILVEGSGHYVRGEFRQVWEIFGGRASFGLPLTQAFSPAEDNDILVQFFEGAVLEYRPNNRNNSDYAELGELEKLQAVVRVAPIGQAYAAAQGLTFPLPEGKVEDADYYDETGHYVREGPFRAFYRRASGTWRLGAPISEELVEEINGVATTVQYFQRGRLEWNATSETVQIGQLGSWQFAYRCANLSE